jgi:hypothetical protein
MSVSKTTKNFPGRDKFVWWTGIVEGRKDPLLMSRIQVRIFGWHTEIKQGPKDQIPTEELLWAHPALACNAHQITHVPKEGDMVMGFFMDHEDAQHPFYMFVLPSFPAKIYPEDKGFSDPALDVETRPKHYFLKTPTRYPPEIDLNEPTTSRTARHDFLMKTPIWSPNYLSEITTYDPVYPYNFSIQGESGHFIDIDDTPDKERITIMHKSGSFIEFTPIGDILIKSVGFIRLNCTGGTMANLKSATADVSVPPEPPEEDDL